MVELREWAVWRHTRAPCSAPGGCGRPGRGCAAAWEPSSRLRLGEGEPQADPSGAAGAALQRAARAAGAENAAHTDEDHSRPRDAPDVHAVLARHGYEPYDDEGVTRLRNCPFQRLAQTHRELVCRANLAFVEGLIQGLTARGLRAVLDPRPGRCCVALS